eukprot:scaffold13385_cov124-Isochrysis_galbana.AAC.2
MAAELFGEVGMQEQQSGYVRQVHLGQQRLEQVTVDRDNERSGEGSVSGIRGCLHGFGRLPCAGED